MPVSTLGRDIVTTLIVLPIAVGTGSALVVQPLTTAAAVSAVALLLAATIAPAWLLAAAWGAILPIYGVAGIPAWVFDGLRLVGAAVILLRTHGSPAYLSRHTKRLACALLLLGAYTTAVCAIRGDGLRLGTFMVLSTVVALAVVRQRNLIAPALAGFAIGACASAVAVVTQALRLATPSLPFQDNGRFPGLGSDAPRTSTELALGCLILIVYMTGGRNVRPMRFAVAATALLTCAAGILLSGGRTGAVGLGIALLLLVQRETLRVRHLGALAAAAVVLAGWADWSHLSFTSIDRFGPSGEFYQPGGFDVTNGRWRLDGAALASWLDHPLTGPGMTAFQRAAGAYPHLVPLTFAVACGTVGLALSSLVLALTARAAWNRKKDPKANVGSALLVVLLTSAVLEPTGPLIGVGLVAVLLSGVSLASEVGDDQGAATEPAAARTGRVPVQAGTAPTTAGAVIDCVGARLRGRRVRGSTRTGTGPGHPLRR